MVLLIEKIILKTNINPKHTLEDLEEYLRQIIFIKYPTDKKVKFV